MKRMNLIASGSTFVNFTQRVSKSLLISPHGANIRETIMKTKLTVTLSVVALFAVGVLNQSTMSTANARELPILLLGVKVPAMRADAPEPEPVSATCFCRVTANGTEVAKPTKGGYVQPFQAEACRNYCRGLWDSSAQQRIAWAKLLPNACGNVSLSMDAALGTGGYQQVRSEVEHGINGTHLAPACNCPSGQQSSNVFAGNKYCITSTGISVPLPDQLLQGGYLVQSHLLYLIHGAACPITCQ